MMKSQYTEQEINLFFTRFKKLPEYFEIEKVHQLINNPDAKATRRINFKYKPFKFIIMTSLFVVGILSILLWLNPTNIKKKTKSQILVSNQSVKEIQSIVSKKQQTKLVEIQLKKNVNTTIDSVFKNETKSEDNVNANIVRALIPEYKEIMPDNQYERTIWPEDSVISGEKFIITLSDKELENIGFMLDETGIYYKNNWNGNVTCFHAQWESNHGDMSTIISFNHPKNKKVAFSNFDFYPVASSNIIYSAPNFSKEEFALSNDTLLPVLIKQKQLKYGFDDLIIWFKISDKFFELLPARYQSIQDEYKKIITLKHQILNTDIVVYQAKNITDGLKFIELSQIDLHKIGVNVEHDRITFSISGNKDYIKMYIKYREVGGELEGNLPIEYFGSEPVYFSNELGERRIQWTKSNESIDKNSFLNFMGKSQNLIPIILRKSDYPHILEQNQILWFEPTNALFDSLPESIGKQLRMEYNYITAETEEQRKELTTNCTYFEACKSTLKVENCKLYPNPANTFVTLEFSLPEPATGNISLVNISGIQLKTLVSTTSFSRGNNFYKFELSGISSGIYMILIKTDKGFKTQRLIISQ